jgi:hypothetical protein
LAVPCSCHEWCFVLYLHCKYCLRSVHIRYLLLSLYDFSGEDGWHMLLRGGERTKSCARVCPPVLTIDCTPRACTASADRYPNGLAAVKSLPTQPTPPQATLPYRCVGVTPSGLRWCDRACTCTVRSPTSARRASHRTYINTTSLNRHYDRFVYTPPSIPVQFSS